MTPDEEQIDALTEIINIGVGRAAGILNQMIHSHIRLSVPFIKIITPSEMQAEMQEMAKERLSSVQLRFSGSFTGMASLVFPTDSASKLISVLTDDDDLNSTDLDAVKVGTLSEVGNIVLNGIMGSISNLLKQHLKYSLPSFREDVLLNIVSSSQIDPDSIVLLARTCFLIEKLNIEGDIILLFTVGSFDSLLLELDKLIEEPGGQSST